MTVIKQELNFEFTHDSVSQQEIKEFEQTYMLTLPDSYKEFLLRNNGGKTDRRRFTATNKQTRATVTSSITFFFPLTTDAEMNLEQMYRHYNLMKVIPNHLCPIGIDAADSLICLAIKGKRRMRLLL